MNVRYKKTNMKKKLYMPQGGEENSVIDYTRRSLVEPEIIAFEICRKPQLCLNILSTLEQYGGADVALQFAKEIIQQQKFRI